MPFSRHFCRNTLVKGYFFCVWIFFFYCYVAFSFDNLSTSFSALQGRGCGCRAYGWYRADIPGELGFALFFLIFSSFQAWFVQCMRVCACVRARVCVCLSVCVCLCVCVCVATNLWIVFFAQLLSGVFECSVPLKKLSFPLFFVSPRDKDLKYRTEVVPGGVDQQEGWN